MVKQLRKTRQRKKFNFNRSRKRMNKQLNKTGTVSCPEIRKEMKHKKLIYPSEIHDMGLVYDSNKALGLPSYRQNRKTVMKIVNGFVEEEIADDVVKAEPTEGTSNSQFPKGHVVQKLEEDANALRVSNFRLPKGQVKWITYLLEKYGFNYIAMAKDSKNYYQETWKQLRQKVKKFLNIPEQSNKWLREQGLENGFDPNDPKWKEPDTDDE